MFVGLCLHQIVKGAVGNVSGVDRVLQSVVEKGVSGCGDLLAGSPTLRKEQWVWKQSGARGRPPSFWPSVHGAQGREQQPLERENQVSVRTEMDREHL